MTRDLAITMLYSILKQNVLLMDIYKKNSSRKKKKNTGQSHCIDSQMLFNQSFNLFSERRYYIYC